MRIPSGRQELSGNLGVLPNSDLSPRGTRSALRHNDLRSAHFQAMLCCMSKRIDIWASVRNVIGSFFGVPGYLFRFLRMTLSPRAVVGDKLQVASWLSTACVGAVDRDRRRNRTLLCGASSNRSDFDTSSIRANRSNQPSTPMTDPARGVVAWYAVGPRATPRQAW